MANSRPSGLGMTFLVGGVLLILGAIFLAVIPWVACPFCGGEGIELSKGGTEPFTPIPCPVCDKTKGGKVTLLKKWTLQRSDPDW